MLNDLKLRSVSQYSWWTLEVHFENMRGTSHVFKMNIGSIWPKYCTEKYCSKGETITNYGYWLAHPNSVCNEFFVFIEIWSIISQPISNGLLIILDVRKIGHLNIKTKMLDIEARVLIGWYSLASQSERAPTLCFYVKVAYFSYGKFSF